MNEEVAFASPITYHSHFVISTNAHPYSKYLMIQIRFQNNRILDKTPNIEIWYPIVGYIWYSDSNNVGDVIGPLYHLSSPGDGFQGLLHPGKYFDVNLLAKIPLEHAERMKSIAEKEGVVRLYVHIQFSALYNQGTAARKTLNYIPTFTFEIPKKLIDAWVSKWSDAYAVRYEGLFPSVPEEVFHDYTEAVKCYNVGAYRAAVAMARRALQQAAEAKGASKKDTLSNQIKWLFDQNLIDTATKNLADGVRWFGNFGAHPQEDLLFQVTKEDAELAIKVLRQRLIKLYAQNTTQ